MAADLTSLARSLPGLEVEHEATRKIFADLESFAYDGMNGQVDQGAQWQNAWDLQVFEHHLKRLRLFIRLSLEAAGLSAALQAFDKEWEQFGDLTDTHWLQEVDALASEPLMFLRNTIDGLRVLAGTPESPLRMADARRLREMLQATAYLVRQRGESPTKEKDIQDVMDDYLKAAFLGDYTPKPGIPGFIKNFKADGGIKSLATAIEFKFVTNEIEMKQALSGILEDTAGYKGSKDWTTFYSVVYQTEPFTTTAHFQAEMVRVDGYNWTPIVVVGGGGKTGKKVKAPKAPDTPATP